MTLTHRLANREDLDALRALMEAAIAELQKPFLNEQQVASSRTIMGLDTQLIEDGTYFVVENDGELAGCGGWSRRATLYGGDQMKAAEQEDPLLDPSTEPARIRAFFVHPDCARRGIGTQILQACLDAARAAGFRRVTLASTLPGVPFYRALGFEEKERLEIPLPDGVRLPIIRMERGCES